MPTNRTETGGGNDRILLVEDEAILLLLAHDILVREGYAVTDAPNGVEALSLWSQHDGNFDLLVTDMVMPDGISGKELADHLKAQKPGLRIIYTSGYSPEALDSNLKLDRGTRFLQKPYDAGLLARTVRECLDE